MKASVEVRVFVEDGVSMDGASHRRGVEVSLALDSGSGIGAQPVIGSIEKMLSESRRIIDQAGTELDMAAGRGE